MKIKSKQVSRIEQLGLVVAATFIAVGCTDSPMARRLLVNNSSAQANAIELSAEASATDQTADAASVEFEVCAAADSWQRPSESEQVKRLSQDPRYAEAIASSDSEGPLKTASSHFWDNPVISFTTYGLSARLEPVTLSGLWTVEDQLWDCYEPEATAAINEGDRAEAWLLNHRITSLQWNGSSYVMLVEPGTAGMQVVQFDRLDSAASLPLTVTTTAGNAVAVVSGDWQ